MRLQLAQVIYSTSIMIFAISRTAAYMSVPRFAFRASRSFVSRSIVLQMAAPGVVCATHDEIRAAMKDPRTTILDVRGVDEIIASGYLDTKGLQYIHSQCTPTEAPLLSVAAEDLIRDKTAPVVVYCAKGFRAAKAKEVLDSKGYENVLNGGGISDLDFLKE